MDWQIELPHGCFYTYNIKALLDYEAFLFDKRFESLNTQCCASSVGGFWEIDAPHGDSNSIPSTGTPVVPK
jgi:hypothetical protein